jgi:hypothetical protein
MMMTSSKSRNMSYELLGSLLSSFIVSVIERRMSVIISLKYVLDSFDIDSLNLLALSTLLVY